MSQNIESFSEEGIGFRIFEVDNSGNGNSNSVKKFSWQVRGGSNFWLAENIALRVQASLVSATPAIGGGLYFGTGGVGGGLSSYSSLLQFGLEGGLVFRITQK